jgi:ABC-type multidrug transport system ATPase subunit
VQAAIEVRAIGQRTRSGNVTLRDVSLAICHGELVAIIGGSGSGKTTLLDAMSGLRPPAVGTVLRDPAESGHVGYVPAADTLHAALPLVTALRYTSGLRGIGVSPDDMATALRQVGLASHADAQAGTLDAGQRKRADIAAELLAEPALLFLEEPTTGLDPAQGAEVMRLLRGLCDAGGTVLLTTQNPLDAARCDKVAVLATGGHLAFFGSPAQARDYFAADSLDEIYERLAGLGDPAAAWSRRFFQFSRTIAGLSQTLAIPSQPGRAPLLPDSAGPHSAGPVSSDTNGNLRTVAVPSPREQPGTANGPAAAAAALVPASHVNRMLSPARRLAILLTRNADVLARSRYAKLTMAGVPVAILLAFLVLLGVGALDGPSVVSMAWAVIAAVGTGVAYGLAAVHAESGVLRRERFAGLSYGAIAGAKALIMVPALAVADLLILAVPGVAGRLTAGFAPAYLTLLLASAIGLALPGSRWLATRGTRLSSWRAAKARTGPDNGHGSCARRSRGTPPRRQASRRCRAKHGPRRRTACRPCSGSHPSSGGRPVPPPGHRSSSATPSAAPCRAARTRPRLPRDCRSSLCAARCPPRSRPWSPPARRPPARPGRGSSARPSRRAWSRRRARTTGRAARRCRA